MNTPDLSRRRFLRGAGALLALPFLESLVPGGTLRAAAKAGALGKLGAPLRTAFIYVPNGVNNAHWWPTLGAGGATDFTLGGSLASLAPHRDHVQIISGLALKSANANGDGAGDHARASASFLTGTQARKTAGRDIRAGRSVDQLIAAHAAAGHRLPSLELSCDAPRLSGNCDSGYSCAYQFNLSWRTEAQPVPAERDPRLVFERLFGSAEDRVSAEATARRAARRASILDFVADDTRRLQGALGARDREKLDDYLTSLRAVEQRLAAFDHFQADPAAGVPGGVPSDHEQHMRLMADLLVLAFRTRSTPVATLLLSHEGSGRTFPTLGITEGHHSLSHHERRADKLEQLRKIDAFYARQFAYLVERMRAVPEGDGTLLDHSLLVYGSGIRDGNRHDHADLPIILAGGAGGAARPGRFVKLASPRPLCDLYQGILGLHGVDAPRFGDSVAPLALG
jgi:hypothetical protein